MLQTIAKHLLYWQKWMRYYLFQKENLQKEFRLVYSNLLIAFQDTFTMNEYRRLAHAVLKKRLWMASEEFFNRPLFNAGLVRYLLSKFYLERRSKNDSLSKSFCHWYSKYRKRIQNNPGLMSRKYLRYHRQFSLENREILDRQLNMGRGVVLCTFHTGLYRNWPDLLTSMGYPVNLLVDQNVYQQEYLQLQNRLYSKKEILGLKNFELLVAEDITVMLKIEKALRQNQVIIFFLDGNTGVGDHYKKSDVVPFLQQGLHIRKGAIYLALKNKTPILPIVSWFAGKRVRFKIYPPAEADIRESHAINVLASEVSRSLYQFFENFIAENPAQWDQWFVCHKFWVRSRPARNKADDRQYHAILSKIRHLLENDGNTNIKADPYKFSYIPDEKGIILIDTYSARFFEVSPFLNSLIPDLLEKGSMQLKKIAERWHKNFPQEMIAQDLTRLALTGYIKIGE